MDLCRICLSSAANKDICELKITKNDDSRSYLEILAFCLDIKVLENSRISTKLCGKCYKKIISFHKFKTLALQNDHYLKTLKNSIVKVEQIISDDWEFANYNDPIQMNYDLEPCQDSLSNDIKDDLKSESEIEDSKTKLNVKIPEIKSENESCQSDDDELLSVVKRIKVEEEQNTINGSEHKDTVTIIKRRKLKPIKTTNKSGLVKKQVCEECGDSVKDLKQHMQRHLPKQERKQYPCQECDKVFCTYSARSRHFKSKHMGIKYHCDVCGKQVLSLHSHMLRIHNPEKMKYVCALCGKRFPSNSLLEIHMLIHTKDRPYQCDTCKKRFRLKVTLNHHIRQVHEKEKSHLCQFCSKSFFKKDHLQIHLRSHTKEKPYKCEECGRAFGDRTTYKNHKETHLTERNYQCDHCDMKFLRRTYLQVHMVCHTKEKRYPCKYCGVRFGRSDHRKRHQYTAHEKFFLQPPP